MLSFNLSFIINKLVIKKLDLGIGLPNMIPFLFYDQVVFFLAL